jgi:hypothetical protein
MSSPNGSIANLLVTRKSFVTTQLGMSLSCSVSRPMGSLGEDGNKKPALERRRRRTERFSSPRMAARGSLDYFSMFA